MKKLMFVASLAMFVAPTLAVADEAVADRLHCGAAEMQVCTTPDADGGGYKVLTDSRAHARTDCDVSQPRGVDLRCVAETDVRTAEEAACRALGGNWRWSTRHERCYQHVEPREDDNDRSPQPPVVVSLQCSDTDRTRLAAELDRIWNDRLVVEDFGPLQLRTVEVYSLLLGCDNGSAESRRLIDLAANMAAAFEEPDPTFPDYTDEFRAIRDQIAALGDRPVPPVPSSPSEGTWCDDNPVACGFLIAGAILAGGAIVVGGVCGAGYCEDGPGLPDHIFY